METNEIIKFNGKELITVENGEQVYFAVKPICDDIGLDADSAVRNIKNDEILGAEACIFNVQIGENQGRNMVCLPIQLLNGWLFSIQAAKVKVEAQPKLLLYKKECHAVLYNHFFGGISIRTQARKEAELRKELKEANKNITYWMQKQRELKKSIELLSKERIEQLGFEFTEIHEIPDHLEGKQFFLTKKTA